SHAFTLHFGPLAVYKSYGCHNLSCFVPVHQRFIPAFPMSFEIERKFLVCGEGWRGLVASQRTIRQAYLAANGKTSIRVRIVDNASATLTIKSRPAELRRLELEYPIPVLEAEALMRLREGSVVEKTRYVVPQGDLAWEIDVFTREN